MKNSRRNLRGCYPPQIKKSSPEISPTTESTFYVLLICASSPIIAKNSWLSYQPSVNTRCQFKGGSYQQTCRKICVLFLGLCFVFHPSTDHLVTLVLSRSFLTSVRAVFISYLAYPACIRVVYRFPCDSLLVKRVFGARENQRREGNKSAAENKHKKQTSKGTGATAKCIGKRSNCLIVSRKLPFVH